MQTCPTKHLFFLAVGLFLLLSGCAAANQPAEAPPPTQPAGQPDSSGPKVIPFFTTESDPNQIVALRELIAEYQRLHQAIERLTGYSRFDVEMVRRVLEAPEVEVQEAP